MKLGLLFFLPGLLAFLYSVVTGPVSWNMDSESYWGIPISLFVFWIGLAHAGTLLSAIFLALEIKLNRRTAMLAELSTLCSLAVAAVFPLMHLGVIENFYMVAPFADARENFANVRSPLVWDFCCIAVYGLLSVTFFLTHLKSSTVLALEKLRRPMAWLLFPLVLWVHTIVSLDFSTTFVSEWRGAFFPIYFVVGAIYSGLALVNALLCTEGYRVRMLERLMLAGSWLLLVIWLWDFLLKGVFCSSAFILAGIVPQLLIVERFRESRLCRLAINLSILLGLFAERFYLVMPGKNSDLPPDLNLVDCGLVAFSVGMFALLFFGFRRLLSSNFTSVGAYFGEVDGSDMAQNEPALANKKCSKAPWASEEFRMLRVPLLIGLLTSILFCVWSVSQSTFENVSISLLNVFPLTYPIMALVTSVVLYIKFFRQNKIKFLQKKSQKILLALGIISFAFFFGMLYGGGNSAPAPVKILASPSAQNEESGRTLKSEITTENAALIWNARCATCHGIDGKFNEKFVREFYPVPQKLDLERLEFVGADSLTKVILNGRVNMNAYGSRLTESEARALVEYMRYLARKAVAEKSEAVK